jgi:hypothetical protein
MTDDETLNDSGMPESLRTLILPYETYYINKADEAFVRILQSTLDAKAAPKKTTSKKSNAKKQIENIENKDKTAQTAANANAFSNLYFEFSNVIRHIHQNLVDGAQRENSFREPLPTIIDFFNKKGTFELAMSPRLKGLFADADRILGDPKSNQEAQEIFTEAKIDFRALINKSLAFFIEAKAIVYASDFVKFRSEATTLYLNGKVAPLSLVVCSRYRLRGVDDYPELAADAIELLNANYKPHDRCYVIVVVFIEQHSGSGVYEKIKFNFENEVYKRSIVASSQITIIPVTLNTDLKLFDEKLSNRLDQIRGKKIDFNYENPAQQQPLTQGWTAPKEIERESGVLVNLHHPPIGAAWGIDFTKAANRDLYAEFRFDESRLDAFRFVILKIIPYPEAITKLDLQIVDRKDSFWMQIEGGDYTVQPSPRNASREFIGRVPRVNEGDGWMTYYIDIEKLFELSFAKNGLKLQRVSAIRFSGRVAIGSISLHP